MSTKEQRSIVLEKLISPEIISILLKDKTTGQNIIWATNDYAFAAIGCGFENPIEPAYIIGKEPLIKPRVEKDQATRLKRSKDKAEVFTPAWVCNKQNNMIDRAWAGSKHGLSFNVEKGETWKSSYARNGSNKDKISFPNKPGKTWLDYVKENRLEITCGEAPYLTSRYDMVTGKWIAVKNRIGLLDRKLRVVGENVSSSSEWIKYAKLAVKATYGFEWQGDNLFLARYNVLAAVIESYFEKFGKSLNYHSVIIFAEIIAWNLVQMDGIKFVIPNTCHLDEKYDLLGMTLCPCDGCKGNDRFKHNGKYVKTMDWQKKIPIRFVDILEGD